MRLTQFNVLIINNTDITEGALSKLGLVNTLSRTLSPEGP